ncbi:MAG: hypothetical protein ACE5HV_04900 [Acidobacteriota bacterium]
MSSSPRGTSASRRERLPPRLLPLLYFGFGHLTLASAFLLLALTPGTLAGFFYQPRMLAVVHLITLGWISCSILGGIYMIAPMALRMRLPASRLDYLAYALVTAGIVAMVGHFWIDSYSGMVWGAGTLLLGLLCVSLRVLGSLRSAKLPPAVKLHIALAFLNILMAGTVGLLLGLEKQLIHVLPGYILTNVAAHAHLAALGWATMMVMGTGYRLLPMFLPAAPPEGASVYASAALLEIGTVGVFICLMMRTVWLRLSALLVVAGLVAFFLHVYWMKQHPRPSPKGLTRPDYGMLQAQQALLYLALSAALGLALPWIPAGEWKLRLVVVYGVFGLVGFLSQMVVGMSARLMPIFAWMHGYVGSDFAVLPPSPHAMPARRLQAVTLCLWSAGVPLLATGFFFDLPLVLAAGAWGLLAAVIIEAINSVLVVRHGFSAP